MDSSKEYKAAKVQVDFVRKVVEMAIENARSGSGGPFAAIVVKDDRIIASGTNTVTTTNDPTAHAEVVAIRNACSVLNTHQLEDCDLYCSCEPCPMCFGAIYWARPRRVFFAATRHDASAGGFDDDMIYQELNLPHEERKIPMVHVAVDGAADVFDMWNRLDDKVRY